MFYFSHYNDLRCHCQVFISHGICYAVCLYKVIIVTLNEEIMSVDVSASAFIRLLDCVIDVMCKYVDATYCWDLQCYAHLKTEFLVFHIGNLHVNIFMHV